MKKNKTRNSKIKRNNNNKLMKTFMYYHIKIPKNNHKVYNTYFNNIFEP